MTQEQLTKIRERCDAPCPPYSNNLVFMENGRSDVRALLDYIEQLQAENDGLYTKNIGLGMENNALLAERDAAVADLEKISLHKNCVICGDTDCPHKYSINGCVNFKWRGVHGTEGDKP